MADGGTTPSWDSRQAAEAWRRGAASRRTQHAAVVEEMFAAAGVGPGMRVLDLGAGTGDQSLPLAGRVGPAGSVLATDVSAPMLELLREDAAAAGLANVATLAGDARTIELAPSSFDAAVSVNCLQFIPGVGEALVRVRRALKPGARLAAVVFAERERNGVFGSAPLTIRRVGGLPPPALDEPGAFSLGAPGRLEAALAAAGFRAVTVRRVSSVRRVPSRAAALDILTTSPNYTSLLDRLDADRRALAVAALDESP